MLIMGTRAQVSPAANYIHAARTAGARVATLNVEEERVDDSPVTRRREGDWYFRGDANATVPEVLREVVGIVKEVGGG